MSTAALIFLQIVTILGGLALLGMFSVLGAFVIVRVIDEHLEEILREREKRSTRFYEKYEPCPDCEYFSRSTDRHHAPWCAFRDVPGF